MIKIIENYIALFFIYSFLGWLMESIGDTIKKKKFVNRGFLIGPYCPIYGMGVLLISIFLDKYKDDILITFFMSLLICGTLEYLTSYLMEKLFKARWWDYSQRKFNINGRICLETLIPFGMAGVLIIHITNPFFLKYINIIPIMAMHILSGIFVVGYIIDVIVSFKVILNLKDMSRELKDNTVEISEKVKNIISNKVRPYRRLVDAFPMIKENVLYERWEEIKQKIEESKEEIRMKIQSSKEELLIKIDISREKFRNKIDTSKAEIRGMLNVSKKNFKRIYKKSKNK